MTLRGICLRYPVRHVLVCWVLAASGVVVAGPVNQVIAPPDAKGGLTEQFKPSAAPGRRADQPVDIDAELADIARTKQLMKELSRVQPAAPMSSPLATQQSGTLLGGSAGGDSGARPTDARAALGGMAPGQMAAESRGLLGGQASNPAIPGLPQGMNAGQPGAAAADAAGTAAPGAAGAASGAGHDESKGARREYSEGDIEEFRASLYAFIDDMKPWALALVIFLALGYAFKAWLSSRTARSRSGGRGGRSGRRAGSRRSGARRSGEPSSRRGLESGRASSADPAPREA